jgi:hypothetical protein
MMVGWLDDMEMIVIVFPKKKTLMISYYNQVPVAFIITTVIDPLVNAK